MSKRVVPGETAAMYFQIVAAYILAVFCVGQIVYALWQWVCVTDLNS